LGVEYDIIEEDYNEAVESRRINVSHGVLQVVAGLFENFCQSLMRSRNRNRICLKSVQQQKNEHNTEDDPIGPIYPGFTIVTSCPAAHL
jgi:hypothetical protein